MQPRRQVLLGALMGVVTFVVVGGAGLAALKMWPAYAHAAPHKTYTIAMLFARLANALIACLAAGTAAARVARAAPWVAGIVILSGSLYIHVVQVWADYPAWYHLVYLAFIVPAAGLAGVASARRRQPFSS
jgi:hypothetical protein